MTFHVKQVDVIVIGGGHAGTEAAAAAARRGARVLLVTFDPDQVGAMSCNPAIGGLGKGHIVREVDAFDGLIARAADAAAIHYRMLNRSKGKAVQGPRVQADRLRYAVAIRTMLAGEGNVTIIAGEVVDLRVSGDRVTGVVLADGGVIPANAVVLASGTFLGGRLFRGSMRGEGGRTGERAATRLASRLRALDLRVARLKTGTPPRLDGRTIDWARLERQPSDREPWRMSPMTEGDRLPQVDCAIAHTTPATHDIVRGALDRSPMFTGAIEAGGPRYCPSIEDKVARFADRDRHQLFLEPEGLSTTTVYPNGISTSLPGDVQQAMIASVPGLERAAIVQPGYAVEYDYLDPRGLRPTLETRAMPGLFCAGQVNGTTGYEEAAGQGLVAGLNAAAVALDLEPVLVDRTTSYLGVMIDDLVVQGVTEPYRMLTARAEYRLALRADNAETRLGDVARRAGVSAARRHRYQARARGRDDLQALLSERLTADDVIGRGVRVARDGSRRSVADWLAVVGDSWRMVVPDAAMIADADLLEEVVEDARYAPYLARQQAEQARLARDRGVMLPTDLDYRAIAGLSTEMIERLEAVRPETLDMASRIRGITPAAMTAILLGTAKKAA